MNTPSLRATLVAALGGCALLFAAHYVKAGDEVDYNRASPALACEDSMEPYEAVAEKHHLQRRDLIEKDAQKFVARLNTTGDPTSFTAEVVTFFYGDTRAFVIFQKPGEACIFKVALPIKAVDAMLQDAGVPQRLDDDV